MLHKHQLYVFATQTYQILMNQLMAGIFHIIRYLLGDRGIERIRETLTSINLISPYPAFRRYSNLRIAFKMVPWSIFNVTAIGSVAWESVR